MYRLKFLENLYAIPNRRFRIIILRMIRNIEGSHIYEQTSKNIYKKYHDIEIGYGTGGFIGTPIVARGTVFGNYCSLSESIYVLNANHPPKYFTTHALMFNPRLGYAAEDLLPRTKLIVGHGVWIGLNAIILPSVNSIGNGAIIAAGSVVTKNVERYTIVGGNPAKMIRSRFTPDVMEDLDQSKWWLLNKEDLIKNKEKFEKIVNYSLEDLKRERTSARLSEPQNPLVP